MSARVLIAGLLGAIAMFIWTSIAHTVTPLGHTGFSHLSGEPVVLGAMKAATNDRDGLYFFPWVDPNDQQMMQKSAAAMKVNPSGLLLYHPAGHGVSDMGPTLIEEFVKELIQSLIAAFIVSMIAAAFFSRVLYVTLIGVSGTLMTNASYWIWYKFPTDYTVVAFITDIVGAFVAGLLIAWWLGRRRA
ncbi:MAG TPA: hypothetical protein VGM17_13140 [Rhizomicrobium sp.]|jgi:hypothetical protein